MVGTVTAMTELLTYFLPCDFLVLGSVWMRVYHFHRTVDFYRPPINRNSHPVGK